MANISFRPNKGKKVVNKDKPQIIYVRFREGRKVDFNASINESTLIDNWDFEKQRIKNRSVILNRHTINSKIENIYRHLNDFDNKNRELGITPSYDDVKTHYNSFFVISENKTESKEWNLFNYIEHFIERSKKKPNDKTEKLVKSGTIATYKLTEKWLKDFNDKKCKIDFDTIDNDWYNDFVEWCEINGLSKNYIGKHIKVLKVILNSALTDGITTNSKFKNKSFKVLKEPADNIALTIDELQKMWQLDLSKSPRQELARDLFLIGAFTGLRVSDFNRLTERNIKTVNGVKLFKVKTIKTGEDVAIPIHPIANAILQKNDGNPPNKLPDQYINEYIKDIAQRAKIDGDEYITKTKGGKEITIKVRRYKLVKTHTARRSFCTNAYLSGIPAMDIMAISGHTTEENFQKYVKVTPEQVAIKMSEHPFFKNATALKVV